jgi:uncharacterized protein involved in copper resistance
VPYTVNDFSLAPGETLDALVKITKDSPYIIYAESADQVGAAMGALITSAQQIVDYKQAAPFPTPQPATMMMPGMDMSHDSSSMAMGSASEKSDASPIKMVSDTAMSGMQMDASMPVMDMSGMDMSSSKKPVSDQMTMSGMDMSATTTSAKYQNVKSRLKTNDPSIAVQTINMALSGYMGRYVWFINGVPEMNAMPIMIEPGKRYRIVFVNNSMMHHPMHIHGHWFILRNGHGAFDPLLHTIDADASGQWIFHCHFLYHMMGGMTRVFRYTTFTDDVAKVEAQAKSTSSAKNASGQAILINPPAEYISQTMLHHPMGEMPTLFRSSYLETGIDPFNNTQEVSFKSFFGGDYNKFELNTEDAEMQKGTVENADMDFFAWHLVSEFWAVKGGVNYTYRPSGTPYWQPGVGIEGLMPYFIDTDLRTYYHAGSMKVDLQLSRSSQITNAFFIRTGIRTIGATKTVTDNQIGSGLNQMQYIVRPYYQVNPALALFTEFNHTSDYGSLTTIRQNAGDSTSQNTLTFGASVLF